MAARESPQPAAGHNGMILGVKEFREPAGLRRKRSVRSACR